MKGKKNLKKADFLLLLMFLDVTKYQDINKYVKLRLKNNMNNVL